MLESSQLTGVIDFAVLVKEQTQFFNQPNNEVLHSLPIKDNNTRSSVFRQEMCSRSKTYSEVYRSFSSFGRSTTCLLVPQPLHFERCLISRAVQAESCPFALPSTHFRMSVTIKLPNYSLRYVRLLFSTQK